MASVNYNDKRFTQVESEKKVALNENEKMYDNMINSSDKYYQQQIDATKEWGETQAKNQQEQTDFAIEKIEQQKDYARKDYEKEQSGAYVDWQKQSNQYGVNAEQKAQNGLAFTGYSESSQVAMYNQYQNRVATARESFNRAIVEYDNMMKDARLQNNAKLAELAYQTLQTTLELSLQGFQYKNTLLIDKANKKAEINDRYYTRYQNVLSQINTENALAEQVRQFNEQMAEEKRQFNETMAYNRSKSSGGGSSSGGSSSGKKVKDTSNKTTKKTSNKTTKKTKSFSTYEEATAYLKKNGAKNSVGGLMTKGEWSRRKSSLQRYGTGSVEVKNYSTYSSYLNDYVEYHTK